MHVNVSRCSGRFGAFHALGDNVEACKGLTWEPWCDCMYPNDADLRVKCKTKPWACCPLGICPPWAEPSTDYGAVCRGMPKNSASSGTYDTLKTLQPVSQVFDPGSWLLDKIVVPEQTKAIKATEATQAQQAAVNQSAAAARASLLRYAKYGAIALVGAFGVVIVMKTARRHNRPAPAPSAPVSGYRKRRRAA